MLDKETVLRHLHSSNNQVSIIRPDIGTLNALTYLDLRHNQIEDVPDEIVQMMCAEGFDRCTVELQGNPLSKIPQDLVAEGKRALQQYLCSQHTQEE